MGVPAVRVLLAGASGAIGSEVLSELRRHGHEVRGLSRHAHHRLGSDAVVADATQPGALAGVCDDIDIVVSALGASVGLQLTDRRPYTEVDLLGNLALLAEARRAGVERMVYVGVHAAPGFDHTRYVKAHAAVEQALAASSLSSTTIKPVGVFSAFAELLAMARRGKVRVVGNGRARTNPVHPRDVAEQVAQYLEQGPQSLAMGGPQVLTRRQIAELAFEVLTAPPRIGRVPAFALRWLAPLVRVVQPRLGELLEFVAAVSTVDAIAPCVGTRTLRQFLEARVEQADEMPSMD